MSDSDENSAQKGDPKSNESSSSAKKALRQKRYSRDESVDRSDLQSLKQKLRNLTFRKDELEEILQEREEKAERREKKLKTEKKKLQRELEDQSKELEEEKESSNKFKTHARKLEKRVTELEDDLEAKKYEIVRKDRIIAESRRCGIDSKLEAEQQSIKEELENEIRVLKEANKIIRGDSNRLQDELNDLKSKNQELNDLQRKNKLLNNDKLKIEELNEKNAELIKSKQLAVEKLRRKIDEHCGRNASLEKELDTLKNTNQTLQSSLDKEKSENEELHCMLKNMQLSLEDHKMKIQALERVTKDSTSKISSISSVDMTMPIRETIVVKKENVTELQSAVINEEMQACPNCSKMFGISLIEQHLEMCLDDF